MVVDETGVHMTTDSGSRTPYWVVGLGLLGVVVVLLAAAFFLNQRLRSHVGIQHLTPSVSKKGGASAGQQTTALPSTISPTAAPTATVQTTPTLLPRQQVMQAYDRYWQAYGQALYMLNTSRMTTVAADGELRRVQAEVAGFRRQNFAVRVRVTHHVLVISVKGDRATVYDQVLNRSFAVDPITKRPGQGSNRADLEKNIYTLKRINGVWKVTKLLRQQG